jgi:hypothetical protein
MESELSDEEFDELLEASSLGAPAVKALIERTPPETAERVRRYLEENHR